MSMQDTWCDWSATLWRTRRQDPVPWEARWIPYFSGEKEKGDAQLLELSVSVTVDEGWQENSIR